MSCLLLEPPCPGVPARHRARRALNVVEGVPAQRAYPLRAASPSVSEDDPVPGAGLSLLRAGAIGASAVMVAFSQGDVVILALLLGLAAGRVSSGVAAAGAAAAVLLRWGSPSLGALAGGQSVLGGAGLTGTSAAASSAWLAAAALVLAATPAGVVRPSTGRLARLGFVAPVVPFGLAAAAVVAGPGPGGALGLRVMASVLAVAVAALLAGVRATPGVDRAVASLAVLFGIAAAVAAGQP